MPAGCFAVAPQAPRSRGELPEQRAGFLCSRLTARPRILGGSVLADWAKDERDGVSPAVLLTADLVADLGSFGTPDRGCPLQPEHEEELFPRPKVRGRRLALRSTRSPLATPRPAAGIPQPLR